MGVKFANKFSTTLSSGINNSVTSLSIASATGFPTISGGHHAYVTLDNGDGTTVEVVKVTGISGTTLTVTRAQDGTSAAAFSAGAKAEIRMTSALLQDVKDEGPDDTVLKVDQSNNRVGILNTSPDVALDVGSATDAVHIPVGTTGQRPGSPAAGYFRYNSTESQFEGYTDSWGEIGGGGATLGIDNFTGDGSDTTFTMGANPLEENNTQVYIDGVYQQKNTYSISGTTLTFSEAPPNTSSVEVVRISASTVTVGTPDDNTVSTVKIVNDAVTYDKIQNVSATDRLLGRDTAGAGSVEEIAPAAVRTMINVEDGATADQTNAEIETGYNAQVAVATQAEAEAGTITAVKRFTPERIKQAIKALSGVSLDTTVKTSAFTAVAGTQYLVNTTSAAITITLPASPSAGDMVGVIDYQGTFATNNVTLGRNGSNVFRAAADGTIDTNNWSTSLKFIDATVGWLPVGD